MRNLMVDKRLWNYAINLSARRKHFIGDDAHQAEPTTAIDHLDAPLRHFADQGAGHIGEGRIDARRRAAIDASFLMWFIASPRPSDRRSGGRRNAG